jgi:TRAP-type C4-dicarboxylate transport system substrate-binding protein
MDLPILNPDIESLRRTAEAWRPRLTELLQTRYGLRMLAIYAYPAQVLFCRQPFARLRDIAGRNVRVSSVSQAELMSALGATPLIMPFADVMARMRSGAVECAVTGTLSGNEIGLHEVTSHVSRAAITWGVSVFAANQAAWDALPDDIRTILRAGLARLEEEIWQAAASETENGLACNAGRPDCMGGRRGKLVVVDDRVTDADHRVALLRDFVLPAWIRRCGEECVTAWNGTVGPALGITAKAE